MYCIVIIECEIHHVYINTRIHQSSHVSTIPSLAFIITFKYLLTPSIVDHYIKILSTYRIRVEYVIHTVIIRCK